MRISDWSSDVCSSDLDEIGATRIIDHELVYPIFRIPADGPYGIAILDQRLEAHVLQDRNHVRERHSRLAMIELEAEGDRRVVVVAIGAHRDPCAIRHLLDHDDVAQRLLGAILLAIAGAEGSAPSFQQLVGIADGAVAGFDRGFELVTPGEAGGGEDRKSTSLNSSH